MSMDLCFQDQADSVQTLLNISNTNYTLFSRFIGACLRNDVVQHVEIVDSIDLTPTGDADYDHWKKTQADEERRACANAQARYEAWHTDTMTLCDIVVAMSACLKDPNHPQYLGYISQIISEGAQELASGNPRVYWA